MPLFRSVVLALAGLACASSAGNARTICTIVADVADGKPVVEEGDCQSRVTPASTFKIALAVMGYDSGFLTDAHSPTLPFEPGYVDWGGENWKQPTDPTRWLKYSVVWYSQQITRQLGAATLTRYAREFGYGNADFSGDPGADNGLDRAWIMSSLQISPVEQVDFIRRLVNRTLPVSANAMARTEGIVETKAAAGGWTVHGKTGAAFPRIDATSFDYARGYGWYVGWMRKGDRTLAFARLIQDEEKLADTPGARARDGFLQDAPTLVGR